MQSRRPRYWWLLAFGLLWPATLFGASLVRFGALPTVDGGLDAWQMLSGGIGFALLGLLSGWLALWLMRRRPLRAVVAGTLLGYLLATPVAFVGGLVGPLALEVFYQASMPDWTTYLLLFPLGVVLAGTVPLLAGSAFGFAIGSAVAARTPSPQKKSSPSTPSGSWHGTTPKKT